MARGTIFHQMHDLGLAAWFGHRPASPQAAKGLGRASGPATRRPGWRADTYNCSRGATSTTWPAAGPMFSEPGTRSALGECSWNTQPVLAMAAADTPPGAARQRDATVCGPLNTQAPP